MRTAIDRFKDAADLQQIAATDLKAGAEGYPPKLEVLVEGVRANGDASGRKLKFLRRIPIDPMTRSHEWGMRSYQDDADSTQLGRAERLRCLHQERGHRARWNEVCRLVAGAPAARRPDGRSSSWSS